MLPFELCPIFAWVLTLKIIFEQHHFADGYIYITERAKEKKNNMDCDAHPIHGTLCSNIHISFDQYHANYYYYFSEYTGRVQIQLKRQQFHQIGCAFIALFEIQAFS